jgi:hypothetical protein
MFLNHSVLLTRNSLGHALIATSLLAFALPHAQANDTSFAEILVDEISTNAAVGTTISFSGDEAAKLKQALPNISSTAGEGRNQHFSRLNIFSPGYMVTISCKDVVSDGDLTSITPECSIRFDKKNVEFDGFPFDPQHQCKAGQ